MFLDVILLWIYKAILIILPFVGTFILAYMAHAFWLHYVRANFIAGIDWVLLEVTPPRDVLRSPKAMELFITNALYHMSNKGALEEYWQGAVWFWFSLEIASIDGQVRYYIRTPTRVKSLIETQMYAQYPQAQVKVAKDYTLAVDHISKNSEYNFWGCEFKLAKSDAFPIKTYVDFGLDKDPKEEYKVDPISPVIELFGSMEKGEQMWLQIIVTPSKKRYHTPGTWWGKHDWVAETERVIKATLAPFTKENKRSDGTYSLEIRAPDFLKDTMAGAGNKMMKVGFDTGIRACYLAKREKYKNNNQKFLRLAFRQYAAPFRNELERHNSTQADAFSVNWLASWFPATENTILRLKNRMLHEYREREFFHPPMRHKIKLPWPISPFIFPNFFHHSIMVLNSEEIATIWHFPGQILKVPTLERIESKEASPPTNLPG